MRTDPDGLSEADREALELMTKLRGKVAVARSFGRIAAGSLLGPVEARIARVKKVASAAVGAAVHVAKQRAAEAIAEAESQAHAHAHADENERAHEPAVADEQSNAAE